MANEEVTTGLNIDITQFKKALTEANRYIRMANSEFDNATAGVEKWTDSTDGLRAKITQLNKTLDAQEVAAAALREEYNRVCQEQGENSAGAQELAIKLNRQEAACKKTAAQIEKYQGNLDEMEASADDAGDEAATMGKDLDKAAKATKGAGKAAADTEKDTKGMAGTFGKAASAAGKLAKSLAGIAGKTVVSGIKGIATASAGLVSAFLATGETSKEWMGNMNKLDAVAKESGRTTEQVRGQFTEFYGILGDETAATTTASNLEAIGLSQENLSSVTNSMAGIWSKYGDSIPLDGLAESINESSRCAKITGNLADALNWAGINEDQFNEKLAACTTEQQRQQLIVDTLDGAYGSLGKTYKEQNAAIIENNKANAELQNALAGVGAASMPVMTALKLMGAGILTDLLPNIQTLGTSFSEALGGSQEAAGKMGGAISAILQQLGQKLISAVPTIATVGTSIITSLVQGLVQAAPGLANGVTRIVQYFIQAAPQLLQAGVSMVSALVGAIRTNLPQLLTAGGEMLHQLLDGVVSNLPAMAQGAMNAIGGFVNGIQTYLPVILSKGAELLGKLGEGIQNGLPGLVSKGLDILMNFATTLYDAAPKLIETGISFIKNLVQGLMDSLPTFIAKAPEIISKFANIINDNFPKILKKGVELIVQIVKGIISAIPTLVANIPKIITAIVDVWEAFNWLQLGKKAITWLKDGITNMLGAVKTAGKNVLDSVTNAISSLPSKLLNLGKTALGKMRDGIVSMIGTIRAAGSNVLQAIVNAITSLPSKLLGIGKNAISSLGSAISNGIGTLKSKAKEILSAFTDTLASLPSKMVSIGKSAIQGVIDGVSAMVGKLYDKIKSALSGLVDKAKSALGINSPSKVLRDEVGKWIPAGIAAGIEKYGNVANRAMVDMAKGAVGAANAELSGSSLKMPGVNGTGGAAGGRAGGVVNNFYQYNTSPKALSRKEIYRDTKNVLKFATSNG